MKQTKLLSLGLTVVGLVLATSFVWWQKASALKPFSSSRISFRYPVAYGEEPRPQQPDEATILIRLKRPEPESLVMLAEEKNAAKGARITRTNLLDYLERNAERQFSQVYDHYQKIRTERMTISGRPASLISFHYTGQDGRTTAFMYFIIIPLDPDAFFLTIQSTDESRARADAERIKPTIVVE